MKLRFDKQNDSLYLRLDETAKLESEEVQPGIILDLNDKGRVVGVEILAVSTRSKPDKLNVLVYEIV